MVCGGGGGVGGGGYWKVIDILVYGIWTEVGRGGQAGELGGVGEVVVGGFPGLQEGEIPVYVNMAWGGGGGAGRGGR